MNLSLVKTAGIVTREIKYGDSGKIVTVITRDLGRISAIAGNVRTGKSHMLAGLQMFAYSEFVLFRGKNKKGLYSLNEVTAAETFSNIRMSLDKLAYASYFAEVVNRTASEDAPDEELLRLLLNALYVLDRDLQPYEKIKTVFEWRLAYTAGYAPVTDCCGNDGGCGVRSESGRDGAEHEPLAWLSPLQGRAYCEKCGAAVEDAVRLTPSMLKIIGYICTADSKKIFSFDASEKTIDYLSRVSELYLKIQLEHEFGTLDYLKKVTALNSAPAKTEDIGGNE